MDGGSQLRAGGYESAAGFVGAVRAGWDSGLLVDHVCLLPDGWCPITGTMTAVFAGRCEARNSVQTLTCRFKKCASRAQTPSVY